MAAERVLKPNLGSFFRRLFQAEISENWSVTEEFEQYGSCFWYVQLMILWSSQLRDVLRNLRKNTKKL